MREPVGPVPVPHSPPSTYNRHHASLGFLFDGRVTALSEISNALAWKLRPATFQELRAHPAVAGVQIETKPLEILDDRKWAKR